MKISRNVSLLPYNTFGIDAVAVRFTGVSDVRSLQEVTHSGILPILILGGGSNILFTQDFNGLVVRNEITGLEIVRSYAHKVHIKVGAGMVWHDFVTWAVGQGYGGVENLSLIPGTVGAAPVQNIGAYGVELKDVFVRLEACDLSNGNLRTFNKTECAFGYRDSIFKRLAKGQYGITSVTFSLTRDRHRINTGYGDLRRVLEADGIYNPDIADVSRAVIRIRSSKLPDPAQIGNCGSFFKNAETARAVLEGIQTAYPGVPYFDLPDGRVKIPAGWLIEQCGWKGKRIGNTGCYEKQALVLVNYGGASGAEVRDLANAIMDSVEKKFGIRLETEVNMI
jgi:UDP-N-acetylmuramate dehydrogenase